MAIKSGTIVGLHTTSSGVKKTVESASKKMSGLSDAVSLTFGNMNDIETARRLAGILGIENSDFYESQEVQRIRNDKFERFAEKYIKAEPEILFTCDYIVDDKLAGCLVVWEKFFDSTHYEVFKKNLFKEDADYERVLFIDTSSLEEERAHFIDYLHNTIGLNVKASDIYVMLDTVIKEDRVYEYKIVASRVPKNATEVDFDMILEGAEKVRSIAVDVDSRNNIFDFTANVLGSRDLAWITSLLNEKLTFFGKVGAVKQVSSALVSKDTPQPDVIIPSDLNDVLKVVNESTLLFGLLPTMEKVVVQCNGLDVEFRNAFLDAIDETKSLFSYDKFRDNVKNISPVFKLVLQVAQSSGVGANNQSVTGFDALSKLSINLPQDTGLQSLSSIEGITKVFSFVNNIYLSVLYAAEKDISSALSSSSFLQDFISSLSGSSEEDNIFQQALQAATTPAKDSGSASASSGNGSSGNKSSAKSSSSKNSTSSKKVKSL